MEYYIKLVSIDWAPSEYKRESRTAVRTRQFVK
jgi:hypothetical protein